MVVGSAKQRWNMTALENAGSGCDRKKSWNVSIGSDMTSRFAANVGRSRSRARSLLDWIRAWYGVKLASHDGMPPFVVHDIDPEGFLTLVRLSPSLFDQLDHLA